MIQPTHFNWLPTQSSWQESEAWRARRQALVQDTLNAGDTANSIFATAATDQIKGLATLAAQAAVKRIKAATKAKIDQSLLKLGPAPAATPKVDKTV
jgi:hypothetical protein